MKKIGIPVLSLFLLWLALSGHYTPLILSFGVVSCLGVGVLAQRLGVFDPQGRPLIFLSRLALYLPWLAREIVASNLDVIRLVWHPRLPIRPHVVRTAASQRTPLGLATFANSVTLTPGTLTLDADEPGILVVHALSDASAEGLQSGEMNRRTTALEGEA